MYTIDGIVYRLGCLRGVSELITWLIDGSVTVYSLNMDRRGPKYVGFFVKLIIISFNHVHFVGIIC